MVKLLLPTLLVLSLITIAENTIPALDQSTPTIASNEDIAAASWRRVPAGASRSDLASVARSLGKGIRRSVRGVQLHNYSV